MGLFEYPVTLPIPLGRWGRVLFWIVAILYVVLITILNVVSVGYEYVQVISPNYNATKKLWYEALPFGSSAPASLICNPTQISWDEVVSSQHNVFTYQVQWDVLPLTNDQQPAIPGTASYAGGSLNCGDLSFSVCFGSPGDISLQFLAGQCNPDGGPSNLSLAYNASIDVTQVPSARSVGPNTAFQITSSVPSEPNSIVRLIVYYSGVLFDLLSPIPQVSSWNVPSNISGTCLDYSLMTPNTIIVFSQSLSVLGEIIFNLTDPTDCKSGISSAYFGLSPDFPVCSLFSWVFGVWSSLALYDFGQLYDLAYYQSNPGPVDSLINQNLFVNNEVLQNYNSFLMNVLFPFQGLDAARNLPPVMALNSTTRLFAVPTPFALTYSCSQRIIKGWLSLLISVLAADIALIIGAYNLFIFVAGYVQKRRIKAGSMCVSGNGANSQKVSSKFKKIEGQSRIESIRSSEYL